MQDTTETLHRFCQVVGKLRLAASVRRNHWWNVPFHLTGRGTTTRPMGPGQPRDHGGHRPPAPVRPARRRPALRRHTEHASYDLAWASRSWQVLSQVNLVLEEFAAWFSGKVSPVHHFWYTFDIAHTRFADRRVDEPATADSVTREAYSREVISFGFWFGDPSFPEPAFYAYTAPEPPGLADQPLQPAAAWWDPRDGSHLAVAAARSAAWPQTCEVPSAAHEPAS